jgi:adenosylcobinamide kinase/adenosylcobinamide-phosphate guanylyltransferase
MRARRLQLRVQPRYRTEVPSIPITGTLHIAASGPLRPSPSTPTRIFVLGGARSGKSRHAQNWADEQATAHDLQRIYIATAQAFDDEMAERIALHRQDRSCEWATVEAPLDLPSALAEYARPGRVLLIDCLTLWLSNLVLAERPVEPEADALLAALEASAAPVAIVSNEVGLGIVPDNALARRFRDAQGRLNQQVAAVSDRVLFLAAGLPLVLK